MGIETAKSAKTLYHLTQLNNLSSIFENGLVSRKSLSNDNCCFEDIADQDIISKRVDLDLDSYVPFHFHPYSAFDVAVRSAFSSSNLVYICIQREYARSKAFKILPKHPLSGESCHLFDYDEGFETIDWNILMTVGDNSDDAKCAKMAECLTMQSIPASSFSSILVANTEIKINVENLLKRHSIRRPPYVNVASYVLN